MRFALIAALFLSRSAFAEFGTPLLVPLHLDFTGGWGYSSASGQTLTSTTNLGQWNFGGSLGVLMGNVIFVGLNSDFRTSAQYSDVSAIDGNFSGKRWNMASPMIGFRKGSFVLKFDYQLLGDYELRNKTAEGASVKYTEPKGWRIAALYQLKGVIYASAFYENMAFNKKIDSSLGETSLSPRLDLSQFGAGLGLVF